MAIDNGSRQFVRGWSSHSSYRRSRCVGLLLTAGLGLATSGCTTAKAPIDLHEFCTADPRFLGTWFSERLSQLGPASMQITFGCDCRYQTLVRFLVVAQRREEGSYAIDGDWISFTRADGGKTVWKFTFEEGRLLLNEEGDILPYERIREKDCPVEPKM